MLGVQHMFTHLKGKVSIGDQDPEEPPKLELTAIAAKALRAHLSRQVRGARIRHRGRGALEPQNLKQRSFAKLLKQAKLPEIRFHGLRHT